MKEKWMAPRTVIEEFTPNEYIAVCWGVACNTIYANNYEKRIHNEGQTHSPNYCGLQSHQYLEDWNNDGIPESMVEKDTDGQGTLTCKIYTDGSYSNIKDFSTVKRGETLYWTTSASDGRVWHHQGVVASENAS